MLLNSAKVLKKLNSKIIFGILLALFVITPLGYWIFVPKLFYHPGNIIFDQETNRSGFRRSGFIQLSDIKISITPALSPTPTLTPSPTPTPLVGYCLKVPVLMYHHIQPLDQAKKEGHGSLTVDADYFDKQMKYLVDHGYIFLNAEQLVNALTNKSGLSGKNIVITMDDGYDDIYNFAYPILQKYHVTASLMIPTGLMNNSGYLNWDQLKNMLGSGLVFAYNHTWSHSSLGAASESKISSEILTAKKQLEENLGGVNTIFTYPYGSEGSRVFNFLASNGFRGAFSTIPGFWQCDSFLFSLHRNRIGNAALSFYGL